MDDIVDHGHGDRYESLADANGAYLAWMECGIDLTDWLALGWGCRSVFVWWRAGFRDPQEAAAWSRAIPNTYADIDADIEDWLTSETARASWASDLLSLGFRSWEVGASNGAYAWVPWIWAPEPLIKWVEAGFTALQGALWRLANVEEPVQAARLICRGSGSLGCPEKNAD